MSDPEDGDSGQKKSKGPLSGLTPQQMREIARQRQRELEKRMNPEQREYYHDIVPVRYRRLFLDAKFNRGLAKKVKFNCLDCTGFSPKDVRRCEITKCAYWDERPYQKPSELSE